MINAVVLLATGVNGGGHRADNRPELYPTLDRAISNTYAKRSSATLKNSLYDSYIRAIRWASVLLLLLGVRSA